MRRGLALARDYARKRVAFGAPLAEKPLHLDTLAGLQAEFQGAFHLTFFVVELLGRSEAGQASEQHEQLLRLLTPVAKLTTGRQAVQVLSEVIEVVRRRGLRRGHGAAGAAARRAGAADLGGHDQRALARRAARAGGGGRPRACSKREAGFMLQGVREPDLVRISARVEKTLEQAEAWLAQAAKAGTAEVGGRRAALRDDAGPRGRARAARAARAVVARARAGPQGAGGGAALRGARA